MDKVDRGIAAGLLALLAGPPLGGFFFGLMFDFDHIIRSMQGHHPFKRDFVIFAPIYSALYSFIVAWAPATAAALFVMFRMGVTGRVSWAEPVILAALCTFLVPAPLRSPAVWPLFLASSLFSALFLRYIAGRIGLVR